MRTILFISTLLLFVGCGSDCHLSGDDIPFNETNDTQQTTLTQKDN